MGTLGDQLREEAAKRSEREAKARYKREEAARVALEEAAKMMADEMFVSLEAKIRAASKCGEQSLDLFNNHLSELSKVEKSAAWKIDSWARQNGMHTHFTHDKGEWDWPSSDSYYICWADHSKDRRY